MVVYMSAFFNAWIFHAKFSVTGFIIELFDCRGAIWKDRMSTCGNHVCLYWNSVSVLREPLFAVTVENGACQRSALAVCGKEKNRKKETIVDREGRVNTQQQRSAKQGGTFVFRWDGSRGEYTHICRSMDTECLSKSGRVHLWDILVPFKNCIGK